VVIESWLFFLFCTKIGSLPNVAVQELENYLHSQKTRKQDELREVAQKLINGEVLGATVSSELSAYELRCNSLVLQVGKCSGFLVLIYLLNIFTVYLCGNYPIVH